MRSWSIPVGRLFGIEIRIHLTFVFLLVFVWGTEAAVQNASAALRGLALVGIVFGSVVLHELGHALVAQGSGVPAKAIILLPIGGVTILDEAHALPDAIDGWKRDIRIAVAGPLVNLFIAGLSAFVLITAIPGFSLTGRSCIRARSCAASSGRTSTSACLTCCRRIPWTAGAFCALSLHAASTWFKPRSAPSALAKSSPS